MSNQALRHKFILDYIAAKGCADATDQNFHELYHKQFPAYKFKPTMWGSQPVYQAQRDLKRLTDSGQLARFRISLGANWQPGFPKWVWTYELAKKAG